MQAAAVRALAGLVSSHPPTHTALLHALQDSQRNVRAAAVQALAGLASSHPPTHTALLHALADSYPNVQAAAVQALAGLASSHPPTHTALLHALADSYPNVRAAAVQALAGLASSHPPTHTALLHALQDSDNGVRAAAVQALAGLASSHPPTHTTLLHALQDSQSNMRAAAVRALAGLASSHSPTHTALLHALADSYPNVRAAAVQALAGLVGIEDGSTHLLVPWLGFVIEQSNSEGERMRRLLTERYAPLLATDEALLNKVIAMLDSSAWTTRQGAAWALIAMPSGPPPEVLPKLTGLLDDLRGEESWPGRLAVAALFVNHLDAALSQEAIAAALEALDYATQPWVYMPRLGQQVRAQAAQILGTLEPLYRDDTIFARLRRVLDEDEDEEVRDAAFGALLRLAAAPERRDEVMR